MTTDGRLARKNRISSLAGLEYVAIIGTARIQNTFTTRKL
jgi:hypothetical protein